jgi:hypothetical protein
MLSGVEEEDCCVVLVSGRDIGVVVGSLLLDISTSDPKVLLVGWRALRAAREVYKGSRNQQKCDLPLDSYAAFPRDDEQQNQFPDSSGTKSKERRKGKQKKEG